MIKTDEKIIEAIKRLNAQGVPKTEITKITGVSSHTVYRYTKDELGTETKKRFPEDLMQEWDRVRKIILGRSDESE